MKNKKMVVAAMFAALSLGSTVVSADELVAPTEEREYIAVDSIAEYIHSRVVHTLASVDSEENEYLTNENQRLSELYQELLRKSKTKDLLIADLRGELDAQLSLGAVTQRYYFATDSRTLRGEQLEEVTAILEAVAQIDGVELVVTGRADPRGDEKYNVRLAQERIDYVLDLAKGLGVNEKAIYEVNLGEVGGVQDDSEEYFFQRYLTLELKKPPLNQ